MEIYTAFRAHVQAEDFTARDKIEDTNSEISKPTFQKQYGNKLINIQIKI